MSLYRKYRPQTFEDVVGQDHVARTLRNALTARPPRVANAYLFTGPRGIGKTTNARLLAKCLNCEQGPTPRPCNQCDFCVSVTNNDQTMDLVEIDAASNTQVDKVRDVIIEKLNRRPTKEDGYRIFIIDEVHMLSGASFNALLKTLEEPPPYVVFILATTEYQKVPATITSRCQRFDFRRVGPADIVGRLQYVAKSENLVLQDDAARLIARHAEGALRDALTLLEQVSAFSGDSITAADVRLVLGGVSEELIHGLIESIASGDARAVLTATEAAVAEGASFGQLARDLTSYARDLMLLTVGFPGDEGLEPEEAALRQHHAHALGRPRIEALLTSLREAAKEMRENVDHRLILELTLVRATDAGFGQPLPAALPRQAAAAPAPPPRLAPVPPAWRTPPVQPATPAPAPIVPATVAPAPPPPPSVPSPTTIHDYEDAYGDEDLRPEPAAPPVTRQPEPPVPEPFPAEEAVYAEALSEAQVAAQEDAEEAPASPGTAPKKGRRIATYEDLLELWPALLMRIRKKIGVTAVAYLHDARPIAFTDVDVVLEFQREFHHAKATEASGRLPFEAVVNEVLDHPRRLRFQLAPRVVAAPVAEAPAPDDDEDEFEGDLLEYTQSIFGAEIVGRSG